MAKKWSDVAASSAFQALSFEEQEEARRQYFEQVIAPRVPEQDVSIARQQFFADTALKRAPSLESQPIDYSDVATDMMGTPAPAPTQGLIQRIGQALRPKSVLDVPYTPTEQERQAEIERRLSYGAGPIRPEVVAAADAARSARVTGNQIRFRDQSFADRVAQVASEMDRRGERSSAEIIADLNRPELRAATAERVAEEFRSPGEWAVDTLSSVSQGLVSLAQLPTNIIAPGSSLAESLRETQKELQAQESEVAKASREVLRRRVESEDGFLGKYFATVKELVTNPTLTINEGLKQIPMFVAVIGGAKIGSALGGAGVAAAGRAAPTVALADAIGGGALTTAARATGATVGGVAANMVMAGGDAAGNTYETLTDRKKTPLSEWRKNPDFQKLVSEGKSDQEAIEEIATTKARMAALITAPLGVLGYMGAEAAVVGRGLGRSAADAMTLKGAAKLVAKDIGLEQVEEGGTQLGSNILTSTVKQDQNLLENVPEAMATAAVTSTPFGVLGAYSQYKAAQEQGQRTDPTADYLARITPGARDAGAEFISPQETVRRATDIGPAPLAPGVANFTPPDSPTKQAGLVDIVVPVPGAETAAPLGAVNPEIERQFGLDKLRMGGTNVGTSGAPGGLAEPGGGAGGGLIGGSMGLAGPGELGAAGAGGGVAGVPGADDRQAVPAGGAAGQQAAGVAPAKIWAGRAGDGYMQPEDAQQALPGLQRKYPDLTWNLQQDADGKFFWSGTTKGANLETTAAAAGAAQGQEVQAAGALVGAGQAGAVSAGATATGAAAPTQLPGLESAGLRVAPTAPVGEIKKLNTALSSEIGVTISPVKASDMNDQQKLASAVARLLGKTLTVVRQETGTNLVPNGMINRLGGKHIYVADNTEDAPLFVAVHEAYHGLPADRRQVLNKALLETFRAENKQAFLDEFDYTPDKFEEEAPAMIAQVVSKREDFWQDLRTKMGNKEFGEVAKVILSKLNEIVTGAKKQYGDDFVKKYITDIEKARDLLSTAYAESMQAQGLKPDAGLTAAQPMASGRSRIGLDFKDVIKRTPELQAAAAKVQAGEMTAAEYDKLVNEVKPVEPYTSVPAPANDNEIRTALTSDKVERIGVPSRTLKAGDPVGLRLDIPAYSNHGTWVVSVHQQEAGYNAGKSIGYEPVAAATNVTFGVVEKAAMNIAAGKPKATIAVIKGGWKPTTPAEAKLKADQALKSKDWVQVGMDPERHSYFYDRKTMEPVVAADEVIQIGPLVLAKNPTYGEKSEFMFSGRSREPIKIADYKPDTDNFNKQQDMTRMLGEVVAAETISKADEFVERYYKDRPAAQVSPEDRLRAEILLRPKMQAAEQVKQEYDQKVLNIAARTGAAGQMLAPIKGIKRAAEKLVEEDFKVDEIKDLLRSTIVVDNYEDALPIVEEIRKEFDVVRIKDRAETALSGSDVKKESREKTGGYADVMVNIRMPNGTVGEIQINTPAMLAAKDNQGHKLYEAAREQPDGSELRREIYSAMRVLYDAVFEAANRRQPSAQDRKLDSEMGAPRAGSDLTSMSSSPESASLKTLPSGSLTYSSPENEATKTQPGGKESGTFIAGSPDASNISQSQYPATARKPRRGTDAIGDFDVRTMKDGTILVYGDAQQIRGQIPEDVKGRVTKDGIVFTNAAAPRVKAALEGRKTAYSRGGAVVDKLPMKDGKYLGAPEKYNTPAKIATLRKSLRKLAMEGERGRYWYENSSREVLAMVGGNVQEARKFVALLAIYSPQAKVDANSTFALRAWAQYRAGQPISVKTGVMDNKARAAMEDVDAFWSGEKTGNFFFNLLREIDPSTAGKQGATIDMWMMRAGEYNNDAPTATQYAFMENETNRLAQELGWEPQQVQAAIWVAMKARMENAGVKKRTEASSEKNGWIRFDYPMKNGRPVKTRVILNAQAHRDNWLKHAFQHVPSKSDTEQAKFDFSDGVRRHIGQISWEARPGRSTGVLPGVNDAPYDQQVEFQQAIQRALLDDDGVDLLAYKLGLLVDGPDILAPGIWQGEVAAGMQKLVVMAPAKGPAGKTSLDPAQKKALDAYAAVLGLLLRQEGVGYHRPFYKGTVSGANGVDINVGRTLTPQEAQALWGAIDQRMKEAGVPNWEDGAGMISSPSGIRVVNFGALPENKKFHNLVEEAASTLAIEELETGLFSTDGDLIQNNWKDNPNGESYQQRIAAAGSPDLLGWARGFLAPRVQAVFDEFSSRYGWGDPGRIQFSQRARPDAAGGGRDREGPQEEVRGQVTPSYGTPRDGAVSAVGYHYSRQTRSSLASSAYGTGLRGAEMARLEGADPRLKQRVYFYIDRGTGINPEAGVGGYAHRVNLQNLYDMDADPLRLARDSGGSNAFEVAVLDAGFDGYMVRDAGPSGNAVLLGRHSVPVEQLGQAGRMETADVVPAARERVLSDSEAIAANKMLPAGQLTGKRWAELISRGMPEVYARLADNPVWQSGRTMYRSELAKELRSEAAAPMFNNREQRQLPAVSSQQALNRDINGAAERLRDGMAAVKAGRFVPKIMLGRLPHVLNMLGARTQDFDIASSIVSKIFDGKHRNEFPDIKPIDLMRAIYRPAMIFKDKGGSDREYELVLPITNENGAMLLPIKVSVEGKQDPFGAVMSAYNKRISSDQARPKEMTIMRRIQEGNLLYVDPMLAKEAMTGRPRGGPKDGVRLNDNFLSWAGVWPTIEELIRERRVKTDEDLMKWIGDKYNPKGQPKRDWADAPAFSKRARTDTPEFKRWFGNSVVVKRNLSFDEAKRLEIGYIERSKFTSEAVKQQEIAEIERMAEEQRGASSGRFSALSWSNVREEPRVMYHATPEDITGGVFKTGRGGAIYVSPDAAHAEDIGEQKAFFKQFPKAPFFSPDLIKRKAENFPGLNVVPVYVRAENPFDYENKEHAAALTEHLQRVGYKKPPGAPDLEGAPWETLADDLIDMVSMGDFRVIESPEAISWIKQQGFDSFYMIEPQEDQPVKNLAVFSSNQLKSAIGNSGAYDLENLSINFSKRAKPKLDADVVSIFKNLDGARGLSLIRAQERVDAHPMAETIRRVNNEFLDILERLDDAGLVKINCK